MKGVLLGLVFDKKGTWGEMWLRVGGRRRTGWLWLEQVLVQAQALQGAGTPRTAESPRQGDWELVPWTVLWADQPCSIPLLPDLPRLAFSAACPSPPGPVPLLLDGCVPESRQGSVGWIQPHHVPRTEVAES